MTLTAVVTLARLQQVFRRLYRWATRRLYRELAWAYELVAWLVSLGQWDAWRRQVLDHVTGERVLEVGFGTGALLVAAARRGLRVWGADPAPAMHRVTARRLHAIRVRGQALDIPRVRAESQALPFPTHFFDTVLATFPAEYIVDPRTLYEVARLLRRQEGRDPAGRFVITGLGFRTDDRWLARLLGLVFGGSGEDSTSWYAAFAEAHGFKVTVVEDASARVRVPVLILELSG